MHVLWWRKLFQCRLYIPRSRFLSSQVLVAPATVHVRQWGSISTLYQALLWFLLTSGHNWKQTLSTPYVLGCKSSKEPPYAVHPSWGSCKDYRVVFVWVGNLPHRVTDFIDFLFNQSQRAKSLLNQSECLDTARSPHDTITARYEPYRNHFPLLRKKNYCSSYENDSIVHAAITIEVNYNKADSIWTNLARIMERAASVLNCHLDN